MTGLRKNELASFWLSGTSASSGGLHRLCKLLQSAGNMLQVESRCEPRIAVVELPAGTTAATLAALVEAAAQSARLDLSKAIATRAAPPPQAPAPSSPLRRRGRWPETAMTSRWLRRCPRPQHDAVTVPRPANRPSG